MLNRAKASDILDFLERAKALLSKGKYVFVPRRKNMQALAQLGITIKDAKREIMELVLEDYYKGPKQDFDTNRPGDIWEFKKNVAGIPFYVKLKIAQQNGDCVLKCLGFHEDEYA